jgi:alkanesulfonate monooxygenase SsuD/methylene tetrahydromethanopterin reductase-like flavin-dependent oxidoreductase (luciferase family)
VSPGAPGDQVSAPRLAPEGGPARAGGVTSTMPPGSGREAPLRFGWRLPMWDPAGAPARTWLPGVHASLEALRGRFSAVWLSDHFVPGTGWMPPEPDTLECWTATAAFATAYPQFDFGQVVLGNSYRHPPLLAKMASTLQLLTGGRLILGIGAGWMESEYRAYGYPFPSAAVRLQQLGEAVQILRRMWAAPPASFRGRHYQIEQAFNQPLPEPPPPIMIGAAGEQLALRLVARHADWWNLSGTSPQEFARKAAVLEGHCRAVGRDPTSILYTYQCQAVALGDSEAQARAAGERNAFFAHTPPGGRLVGTPEQVTARLQEYVDLGVRHFMLRFLDFPSTEGALRFAAEVAPRLRV